MPATVGNVTFGNDAVRGQVVVLPGGDDQYLSIEGVGISGTLPRTIACWAKADNTNIPNWTLIFGFTGTVAGGGGGGSHFNIGSRVTQTSSFPGSVDDAVIYSVELTAAEIAWLAGRTTPMHMGF